MYNVSGSFVFEKIDTDFTVAAIFKVSASLKSSTKSRPNISFLIFSLSIETKGHFLI